MQTTGMLSEPAGQELRSNVARSWAGTADATPSGAWKWCGRTSKSLRCASATLSRGHLKCEAQPTPSQMSATARWHQQLGPPRHVCCDLARRRLPEAASAQELASGRLASRMHPGNSWPQAFDSVVHYLCQHRNTVTPAPASKAASTVARCPLHRCRVVAYWPAHL